MLMVIILVCSINSFLRARVSDVQEGICMKYHTL